MLGNSLIEAALGRRLSLQYRLFNLVREDREMAGEPVGMRSVPGQSRRLGPPSITSGLSL